MTRSLNAALYEDRFLLDAVAISDRCDCNWLGLHGRLEEQTSRDTLVYF